MAPTRFRHREPHSHRLLIASFLLRNLLGLFLLLAQKVCQPREGIARDDQTARDDSLAASDIPISTALLVLVDIGVQCIVLGLTNDVKWEEDEVQHATLQLLCVFLHNREFLVGLAQHTVCDLVGLVDVGCDVAVWLLRVRHNRRYEVLVPGIRDIQRLLAIGVLLDGIDGIRDDGVRLKVLREILDQHCNI